MQIKYLIIFLILINSVYAGVFNIDVRPKSNSLLLPNSTMEYWFNFSSDSLCSNILLSNHSSITTDPYGIGNIQIDVSSLKIAPNYLCEYRNNSLRAIHQFPDGFFDNLLIKEGNIYNNLTINDTIQPTINNTGDIGSPLLWLSRLFVNNISINYIIRQGVDIWTNITGINLFAVNSNISLSANLTSVNKYAIDSNISASTYIKNVNTSLTTNISSVNLYSVNSNISTNARIDSLSSGALTLLYSNTSIGCANISTAISVDSYVISVNDLSLGDTLAIDVWTDGYGSTTLYSSIKISHPSITDSTTSAIGTASASNYGFTHFDIILNPGNNNNGAFYAYGVASTSFAGNANIMNFNYEGWQSLPLNISLQIGWNDALIRHVGWKIYKKDG